MKRAFRWLTLEDRWTAIAMTLVVLYYVVTWGPWQGKASGDGWFGFLYLKAIFYHHTLDMKTVAPEFERFFGSWGPGKHMPNRCPFGPVLLWFPLYLLVAIPEWILLSCKLLHRAGWNGQSSVHVWVTGLATLAAVLVGWRQTMKLMMRHVPVAAARIGAIATVCATPLLWYTCHQPFYQHGIAFLLIATFFEYWERTWGEVSNARFVWCGVLLGYATSVRAQESVYVLPIAIEILAGLARGPRRIDWLRGALVSASAFLVAFTPQALVWLYYSGKVAPIQAEPIRWSEPWPMVVLFSSRAGLFPYTPIAFVGVWGVLRNALRRDATGRLLRSFGLAFLVGFYVVSCAWVVAGAYSYGARRLSDAMGLVGFGVALVHARLGPREKKILVCVLVACIALNVAMMELLKARLITSPGSATRSIAGELDRAHAPQPIVDVAAKVGWPFCEPASAIWSLVHHVPIATFETVVGEQMLERDGQWLTLINQRLDLSRALRFHVAEGLSWDQPGDARVTGRVRIPMGMFATEPVQLDVTGHVAGGRYAATWNDDPVAVAQLPTGLRITNVQARAGYDELVLDLPIGSTLSHIDFTPKKAIARPSFP